MALTPAELQVLIDEAGAALQGIQNELGRDGNGGKVRFPRGYLKRVHERIGRFAWIDDDTLKRNLCYHLIFSDVLRWILNRTDLANVARGMVVKHTIAVMGAVVESLTVTAMKQLGQGKRNFAKRVAYLCGEGLIDEALRDELLWLWEARSKVHVYDVTDLELDTYEVKDSNRAITATCGLSDALNMQMLARAFPLVEAEA
jgi:hypothetical protein